MEQPLAELGMIGLGVVGRSLVLNLADHGFPVAGYDKDLTKGQTLLDEGAGKPATRLTRRRSPRLTATATLSSAILARPCTRPPPSLMHRDSIYCGTPRRRTSTA